MLYYKYKNIVLGSSIYLSSINISFCFFDNITCKLVLFLVSSKKVLIPDVLRLRIQG